ncbi:hypothetical protein V5F29_07035 [Xanthobacter aminoxidans]|uniref:hypothetical protein n=1 Tax=Xanthobacter aminoxidans TaxID=186280 RepID=UPI00372C9BA9
MSLAQRWAGRVFGTNVGNVFIKFSGEDAALSGSLHFNEGEDSSVVYAVSGKFDGVKLILAGVGPELDGGRRRSNISLSCDISAKGELIGEWEAENGSAGTIHLFPHNLNVDGGASAIHPEQLHTARYNFGAIEIDRDQIIALADEMQKDFKSATMVVTVVTATERSMFLPDFKTRQFGVERIIIIKLFLQEMEPGGLNRIAQVEFGPSINTAMTQGGDEAWVLGALEKIKRWVRPYERMYTTNFKKFGFGINQLLLVGTIVILPSLSGVRDRSTMMCGVLFLIFAVNFLHQRYLPFAAIYLSRRPQGLLSRLAPSMVSWVIAATAGIAATLLAAYLQGVSGLP